MNIVNCPQLNGLVVNRLSTSRFRAYRVPYIFYLVSHKRKGAHYSQRMLFLITLLLKSGPIQIKKPNTVFTINFPALLFRIRGFSSLFFTLRSVKEKQGRSEILTASLRKIQLNICI